MLNDQVLSGSNSSKRQIGKPEVALVVVAHPDDEVLWAGGNILLHSKYAWNIYALCRQSDPDREPRFRQMLGYLRATGDLGDLDDGPEQLPLSPELIEETIRAVIPACRYDLVFTHSPRGEYTRHRRHEELGRAVLNLWGKGVIDAAELRLFAYEDGQGAYLPRAISGADIITPLPESIWREKFRLITEIYGFASDSHEARMTPRTEAFWQVRSSSEITPWLL